MKQQHKGEYPPDWKEIAARVKAEAGNACVRCGHVHDPAAGYTLTVHHLDCDKGNVMWWNLVALCQRCHLQIQGKVIMDRIWFAPHSRWFEPYYCGFVAHKRNLPEWREWVLEHRDELLRLGQPWLYERNEE